MSKKTKSNRVSKNDFIAGLVGADLKISHQELHAGMKMTTIMETVIRNIFEKSSEYSSAMETNALMSEELKGSEGVFLQTMMMGVVGEDETISDKAFDRMMVLSKNQTTMNKRKMKEFISIGEFLLNFFTSRSKDINVVLNHSMDRRLKRCSELFEKVPELLLADTALKDDMEKFKDAKFEDKIENHIELFSRFEKAREVPEVVAIEGEIAALKERIVWHGASWVETDFIHKTDFVNIAIGAAVQFHVSNLSILLLSAAYSVMYKGHRAVPQVMLDFIPMWKSLYAILQEGGSIKLDNEQESEDVVKAFFLLEDDISQTALHSDYVGLEKRGSSSNLLTISKGVIESGYIYNDKDFCSIMTGEAKDEKGLLSNLREEIIKEIGG